VAFRDPHPCPLPEGEGAQTVRSSSPRTRAMPCRRVRGRCPETGRHACGGHHEVSALSIRQSRQHEVVWPVWGRLDSRAAGQLRGRGRERSGVPHAGGQAAELHPAARQPLALIVEDVHWIDQATEEVLTALIGAMAGWSTLAIPWRTKMTPICMPLSQGASAETPWGMGCAGLSTTLLAYAAKRHVPAAHGCRVPGIDRAVRRGR
jgi:hypothetical protein